VSANGKTVAQRDLHRWRGCRGCSHLQALWWVCLQRATAENAAIAVTTAEAAVPVDKADEATEPIRLADGAVLIAADWHRDVAERLSVVASTRPAKFEDRYEKALHELIAKKQAGERIEAPKARASAKVINLMDALKGSIAAETGGEKKPPAPSQKRRERKPVRRSRKVTRRAG
jgi:hypothetical protein